MLKFILNYIVLGFTYPNQYFGNYPFDITKKNAIFSYFLIRVHVK